MKILKFPEFIQSFNYDCGAKATQAVLAYYGIDADEKEIIDLAGTNRRTGTPIKGFKRVAQKFGFKCRMEKMTAKQLKRYINLKIPVIILVQSWVKKEIKDWNNHWKDSHYVAVIGYDDKRIYFKDPAAISRTYLSFDELEERWHGMDLSTGRKYKNLGIVFYGKKERRNPNRATRMD